MAQRLRGCAWQRLQWTQKCIYKGPVAPRASGRRCLSTRDVVAREHLADDGAIRDIFDAPRSARSSFSSTSASTGLFDNRHLVSPEGMAQFTQDSLRRAQELSASIIGAGDTLDASQLKNAIRYFDILSDVICKVVDMVAFVRISHPDKRFVQVAQESHEIMYDFMNMLNTSVQLHDILDRVMSTPEILAALSPEETIVGEILLADFKKSGVNLDPTSRQRFVDLSSRVSILGQQFLNNIGPAKQSLSFSKNEVWGLAPTLAGRLKSFGGRIKIPTYGPIADVALQTISNEDTRRQIWLAQRTATDEQVGHLVEFLRSRAELATMMGYTSYADYELKDKMARSPANVNRFLVELAQQTGPRAKTELADVLKLKAAETQATSDQLTLNPWDREFYSAKVTNSRRSNIRSSDVIPAYFSLGTVMQGLSRLFSQIYGIRFVPVSTKAGEVWDDEVRRLDVVSEKDGKVGVIYCDLFQRDGKSPHPAHFTVQCSREVMPFEPDYTEDSSLIVKEGRRYQLPIIALVCDFVRDNSADKCLLSFGEVQTLFHEMGHAIHSMLGRTSLHNVSGTRCATDFVELPSVIMESFAASPKVMGLFARHHLTDEPLSVEAFQAQVNLQAALDQTEVHHQILLSLLDQKLHSEAALESDFDPNLIFYKLQQNYSLFTPQSESRWPAQFGHLFGYGANYYCYLFDRAIAHRIWDKLFVADPTSREAGERFHREVLAWGGSRDPWTCIAGVLDQPELASGDEAAMLDIGRTFV